MVLPSLGQAQLGARRGRVGECLKAILAYFFGFSGDSGRLDSAVISRLKPASHSSHRSRRAVQLLLVHI